MVSSVDQTIFNQNLYQQAAFVSTIIGTKHSQNAIAAETTKKVSLRSIADELNSHGSLSLHDQIFFHIKKALDDGQLEDVCDGRLPSLRNMSATLGVSRETVSKAISKLTGYGYLSAEERKRIYVLPRKERTSVSYSDELQFASIHNQGAPKEAEVVANDEPMDFRPPAEENVSQGTYSKNYLTHKYLKTLRRQSAKRPRADLDPCGLVSFREVLCEQLKRDSNVSCQAENLIVFPDYKSCIDFIVRLTTKQRSCCVVEAPGSADIASLLDLNARSVVEIPVDEEGMRTDILNSYGISDAVCFVSPSMQEPLGVRLSHSRTETLVTWAKSTNSIIVEHSSSQGFLRLGTIPSVWQANADYECVFAWTITSALKPWTQTCCAVFSDGLIQEARRLKLIIGGEVAINEQMAIQDFILDGDLLRAQRQRELVNLEKRRRLGLAFSRVFRGFLSVWKGNCGPKMVFSVSPEVSATHLSEMARTCGLPARLLDESRLGEQHTGDHRLVVDLDLINLDGLSGRIEQLEALFKAL